jgi:hypothetical protein
LQSLPWRNFIGSKLVLRCCRRNFNPNDRRFVHFEAEELDRTLLDLAGLGPDDHLGVDGLEEDEEVGRKVVVVVFQHLVSMLKNFFFFVDAESTRVGNVSGVHLFETLSTLHTNVRLG